MLYVNRLNIYSICWSAVWPISSASLIQPLLWPVVWSPRSICPAWWTVSLTSLTYTVIGDILSIPMNVAETCWIVPLLEAVAGYMYMRTTTMCSAQLCCTKLIIIYEYCWYYGVLGDRAVFPDCCSVLVIL